MHSSEVLSGPVYLFVVILMYGTGLLSLFVVVDSLRAVRAPLFAARPGRRWLWTVPQTLYLLVFLIENVPFTATGLLATVLVIATIPALIHGITYLLQVVYPPPGRGADEVPTSDIEESDSDSFPE